MSVLSPPDLFFYNILFCHVRRFATQRPSSSSTSACQTSCPAVSTCRWPPPPSGSVPGVTVASCVIFSLSCATDWRLCHSSPSSPSPSTATSWSAIRHYTQSTYFSPGFVWILEKGHILSWVKGGSIVRLKLTWQYRDARAAVALLTFLYNFGCRVGSLSYREIVAHVFCSVAPKTRKVVYISVYLYVSALSPSINSSLMSNKLIKFLFV